MNAELERLSQSAEHAKWLRLERRHLIARISTICLVPVLLVVGFLFQSGEALFLAFLFCVFLSVVLHLRAIYTPCPSCGWPFGGSDFEYSSRPRWSLNLSKQCRHCGATRARHGPSIEGTTAGRTCSLRHYLRRRCVPLMSNV